MSAPAHKSRPPPGKMAAPAPAPKSTGARQSPARAGLANGLSLPYVSLQFETEDDSAPVQRDCSGDCAAAAAEDEDLPGPGGFQRDAASGAPANPVASAHATARDGTAGAADPLPFRDRIQSAFGHHDISDVRSRTGGKAAKAAQKLGANGYTRQRDIAFRETPSLRLAAHEAAHTVQQARGVQLDSGIGTVGDAYETQADEAAEVVMQGQSAEALLDEDPGNPSAKPGAGPAVQHDCGCGGTCASCRAADEGTEDDALQMELSVTVPPKGAVEEAVAQKKDNPAEPDEDAVKEQVAKAEDETPEKEITRAEEESPDTAEASAAPSDIAPKSTPDDGPAEKSAAPEKKTAESDIPPGKDSAARAERPSGDEAQHSEEDTLQRVACGPTSEPADVEEPSEPPPGEVQENAEGEGPSPADEGEDPNAMQDAVEDVDSVGAAEEAARGVSEADPAQAEAAMSEAAGGGGATAAVTPALTAESPMGQAVGQGAATRDAAVNGYDAASVRLEATRSGANGLAGMPASFRSKDRDRDDLAAASANVSAFLSRAATGIAGRASGLEAEINQRAEAGLVRATGQVEAATAAAQVQLTGSVSAAKTRTMSQAATDRVSLDAQHTVATAGIVAQAAAALARVDAAELDATTRITGAQAAQAGPIIAAYATGERQVREAGRVVGAEAMNIADRYKAAYRQDRKVDGSGCIEDSWYDGCLCDRRARARMTAADQVGEGYRDSLVEAAGKQADGMQQGMPTDFANVAKLADKARETVTTQTAAIRAAIDSRKEAALAAVTASHASAMAEISATEATTLANLGALQASQMRMLADLKFIQIAMLEETAHAAAAAALDAVAVAVQSATSGVAMAVAGLISRTPPPEKELASAIATLDDMLGSALSGLSAGTETALAGVDTRMAEGVAIAQSALSECAASGADQAAAMGDSAAAAISTLATETIARMTEATTSMMTDTEAMATGAETGLNAVVTGLEASYATMIGNLAQGFTKSAENLETGLRDALDGMHTGENSIPTKAQEAAAKEKPAWQSVLKWVLIIAIVIVVAVVAGPAVIGAIGGLAAGMGASAGVAGFIGATVGGALLGAATGATIQVVNNVFDGNPWHEGVARAAAVGLVTGALGGAVGFGISAAFTPAAQAGQAVARSLGSRSLEFGANLAADATMEIGQQLIETGGVDWGGFGVAMAFSVGTAGLGEVPGVKRVQEGISSGVNESVTGAVRSARGSAAEVRVDTDIAPRIEAEAEVRPEAAAEAPTRPPEADTGGEAPTRPAEAESDATVRAEADDAADPRIGDDGSIRDADLSDVSARAAQEPDAPRLEAEPDIPARRRSDSELAEAAEPVRLDGEDHTLVPRRWIDGEVRLFLCTDCGPVLNKIDQMRERLQDPAIREEAGPDILKNLENLSADVRALEARLKAGESGDDLRADMQAVRARAEDIESDVEIAGILASLRPGENLYAGDMLEDLMVHAQSGQVRADMRADPDMPNLRGRPGRTPHGVAKNPEPGYQSAHLTPQSTVRSVAGVDPGQMITRMLPTGRGHKHTVFDQNWQKEFRRIRQANPDQKTISAQEVYDVVNDAIHNSGAFSPGEALSTSALLFEQMFITEGFLPTTLLRLPGS